MDSTLADILGQEAATAPGDLPLPLVLQRSVARRSQFRHDNVIRPLAPRPGQTVTVKATSGEEVGVRHARIFYTFDGGEPSLESPCVDMAIADVQWNVLSGYLFVWTADLPARSEGEVVRYRIAGWAEEASGEPDLWAQDGQGFWFRFGWEEGISTFAYRVEESLPAPAWIRDGVVYQIFLDRFRPSEGRQFEDSGFKGIHGGAIDGVTRSLEYLEDLGVTCLWLSPLHPAETYHRYDGLDYFAVDGRLGGSEALRRLTSGGKARGLRFLMDFVPSHCSWHHPAFLRAQADRNASERSWFTFYDWPAKYRTFLDLAPHLPSLNTDDPGARRHLIEAAVHWIRDYGIDGFRLDHAIGPSMDFWVAFRAALKAADPESFTVGEATDTPDALRRFRNRLDAILDFPLARALRSTFAMNTWTVQHLDNFLNAYDRYMEAGPFRLSFLDNHDMDRFLFLSGNRPGRLRMAALCQFALLPTPIVYYGTEIGLRQEHPASNRDHGGDAQVRGDMPWDRDECDEELRQFYRALIRLRRERRALREGGRTTLHLDSQHGTYLFRRTADGEAPVVAAFHLGASAASVELDGLLDGNCLIATGEVSIEAAPSRTTIRLGPESAALLA